MMEFLIRQHRAINICFVLVFVLGYISLSKLGREELPELGGEGLNIHAILPGATPEEMDLKVARLIHTPLVALSGVEDVSSVSREGFISIRVEVKEDEADLDGLRREIAQLITQLPDLPPDLEGPFVNRQIDRLFPPLTLLFKGGNNLERHNAWVEIEQRLLSIPSVDAINVLGDRERRFEVRADPIKLEQAGMRIDSLVGQVRNAMTDSGAGKLRAPLENTRIRTNQQPKTTAMLEQLMLSSSLGILPVSSFAKVVETLEPEQIRVIHDDELAWYANLYRRKGTNVSELSTDVNELLTELNERYLQEGKPFEVSVLYDRSREVTISLSQLTNSVFIGMALVFLILWLFLGTRTAFYAAIGIPFSFFATFIAMDLLDLSINIITLFGLVLVSGMIVDDAIVVLENIDRKKEAGNNSLQAIKEGMGEVAPAVMAATGTTIAVFLPLMLMSGGMGQYFSLIPKVAILALVASLVECFIVLPVHLYSSGSTGHTRKEGKLQSKLRSGMEGLALRFSSASAWLVARPYSSLLFFLLLLIVTTAIAYLRLDFKFFEASETRSIKFHLEFDREVDLESNFQLLQSAIKKLKMKEGLDDSIADVVSISGFSLKNYNSRVREYVADVELPLTQSAIEEKSAVRLANEIEPLFLALPGIKRVQRSLETNSPPTSVPVEIFLYGENADSLETTAKRVRSALQSIPSIMHISDPMEDGVREKVFNLDSKWVGFHGMSSDLIGRLLRTSITGTKVGKIDRGSEVVDVYVTADKRFTPLQLIARADGSVIPIDELGGFVTQSTPDSVRRYQGLRYISITAEVDEQLMSVYQTHREIEKLIDDSILGPGITFEQQGEYNETRKSLASMLQSAIIGLGLSYLILTLLFRSFLQPMVVLLSIPLAYMGVVWGMTLTNQPLSMLGFVGVVGLIGIVINDSLVWVNFYNRALESGMHSTEAAVQAVKQRFRPIWLTTITTVGGMLPTSLSQSAGIANSMASTMVYGLVSASLFLLLFLPVCVVVLDDLTTRSNKALTRLGRIRNSSPSSAKTEYQ